jgi:hypothetical protein
MTIIPKEHDFTMSFDEWEKTIFLGAEYFYTIRFKGQGKRERREFVTFQEAIDDMVNDIGTVNCIAQSERFICIDRKDWSKFLQIQKDNQL